MSTHTGGHGEAPAAGEPLAGEASRVDERSEAELRAAYEAELSRVTSGEVALQAAASLLNIGAHRLGLTGAAAGPGGAVAPGDLEQVRDAIDAVRGLLPVIERSCPAELRPLRDALAQLQMAYARQTQAAGPAPEERGTPVAQPQQSPPRPAEPDPSTGKPRPGPAETSGRLWVPGR